MGAEELLPLARNPNVVEPPAAIEPLYVVLLTDTAEPLVLSVPFQAWVMVWPELNVHRTVQPLTGWLPAVTVTSPWKPPDHEFTVR